MNAPDLPDSTASAMDRLTALLAEHGELMGGQALWRNLGFRSDRSFLRAAAAGKLPVATFHLPDRRGRFARTRDVAAWLAQLGGAQARRALRAGDTTVDPARSLDECSASPAKES